MTGVRAPRGASPDAGAAVSSNSAAQLLRHVVGDREVPPSLDCFLFHRPSRVGRCYLVMTWTYMVSLCSFSHIMRLK